ncbi:MAG TPA: TonB-dependent receptor [Lysobacter sp.]|nr:TonB-dependent receptor [Lysobacter sp.]
MTNALTLRRSPLALALCLALAPAPALAAGQDDPRHTDAKDLDHVVVTASPLRGTAEDLTHPVEVLAGERLDEVKASSLGETVNRLPGVQSSYFGPGVGRPIVRGLEGARVQVLAGGLSAGDVSTVSVDHAVSIEPFLADQIEVLKGPATLLYGSGAIGGAVNVVDGRIPETRPERPFGGRAELRAGTVNDERTGMVRLDGGSDVGLAFHFDALQRETDDFDIPGYPESARLLAEEQEEPDPAERGVLTNSALRTSSGAFGLSWVGERGFLGAGYSLFSTRYGIPGHAHEHEDEPSEDAGESGTRVVLDQHRTELRGGLDRLGVFESLRVKAANTEYTHTEYEGDEVGTVFENDTVEARLELTHAWAGWTGAFGVQWTARDFAALGEEAFVPGSRSRDAGVFWVGQRAIGPLQLEVGARYDRNRIDVDEAEAIGPSRKFDAHSLSAALKWEVGERLELRFGLDRAQRTPGAEELYSNGLHVATRSYEFGDPTLDTETANRAELGLHWHGERLRVGASLYHVRYDDFIYLAATGIEHDGTPARAWTQGDARFTGGEAEIEWTFVENASGSWQLRAFGDVVRARLDGGTARPAVFAIPAEDGTVTAYAVELGAGGDLPRIAAPRFGGELRWERGAWRAALGAVRYRRQDRVAAFEEETPGYTLVDAHIAWHVDTGAGAWELFLDGNNLTDEEARPHTSFLKDLAPLPGRNLSFGVRVFF